MDVPVVAVRQVEKRYATVRAVGGVSFDVRAGEIFVLLGPNGAGKTTLTRMILGIIRPDAGSIAFGFDGVVTSTATRQQTGYLPEDRGLFRDIPILRTLVYFGRLRGLDAPDARRRALDWLERLDLADRADERLDALSRGNQQKVQLISAVLHDPPLAVLDEPFAGFDPVNQELLLDLMRALRDRGITILLSAHHMDLVERIADRVMLLRAGQAVLLGTLDELRRGDDGAIRLEVDFEGHCDVAALRACPAVASAELDRAQHLVVMVRSQAGLATVMELLREPLRVRSIHGGRRSLHDIYLHAVGDAEPLPAASDGGPAA